MSEKEISGILKDLAANKKRTETAKLREIFDDVNFAIQSGVSQETILEQLKKIGFTFGINGFKYSFNKIRKERGVPPLRKKKGEKSGVTKKEQAPAPTTKTKTATTQQLVESESGVFEPAAETSQQTQARITNPAEIRRSRRREVNLDELTNKE
jgi:hypothetical protein